MLPLQRLRGTTPAGTIGLFAVLGAFALPVIAVVSIGAEGPYATVEQRLWWLRFGGAEAVCVFVMAWSWQAGRRARHKKR